MEKINFWKFNILLAFNTLKCVNLNSKQLLKSYLGYLTYKKNIYLKIKGADQVNLCKSGPDRDSIESYYNVGKKQPVLLDDENPNVGISNEKVEIIGNYLICSFKRKKNLGREKNYFDLQNENFFILGAYGAIGLNGGNFI